MFFFGKFPVLFDIFIFFICLFYIIKSFFRILILIDLVSMVRHKLAPLHFLVEVVHQVLQQQVVVEAAMDLLAVQV
jgi:hypothetical protein